MYCRRPTTSRRPKEAFQDINNPGGELLKAILRVSSAINMKTSYYKNIFILNNQQTFKYKNDNILSEQM